MTWNLLEVFLHDLTELSHKAEGKQVSGMNGFVSFLKIIILGDSQALKGQEHVIGGLSRTKRLFLWSKLDEGRRMGH